MVFSDKDQKGVQIFISDEDYAFVDSLKITILDKTAPY